MTDTNTIDGLTYKYYRKLGSEKCILILHGGGSQGIETDFISLIFERSVKLTTNVFAFNFKYCERGDDMSSGPELQEEQDSLLEVINFLKLNGNKEIIIIAKSLSAVTASYLLDNNKQLSDNLSLVILGYVKDEVRLEAVKDSLVAVVQGELDKYATPEQLAKLFDENGLKINIRDVKGADHSYRDDNKDPVYQDEAIKYLVEELVLII